MLKSNRIGQCCGVVCIVLVSIGMGHLQPAFAQVTDIQPRACRIGETTRLTVTGKELDKSLRLVASNNQIKFQIESASPEQAVIQLTLPPNCECGPFGIWAANHQSISDPFSMIADDLPVVARDANNITRQAAQQIAPQVAIAASSRGAQSDFYRFHADAGQRVAFEVLCQSLHSSMDPLVRLSALDGREMRSLDEAGANSDIRFSHKFDQAGDYVLELLDSRYAGGGVYHLRVGDFPVLGSAQPTAVQRGQTAQLSFRTLDGEPAEPRDFVSSANSVDPVGLVTTRRVGGASSAWLAIRQTELAVLPATNQSPPVTIPSLPQAVSGCLSAKGNTDSFVLTGKKDQTIRFSSFTRSLGSAAVLKMQLFNASGAKVAETAVSKDDQWSFDFKFPDDGQYTLKVFDLLHRGGEDFHYCLEMKPSEPFSLAIKGDAKSTSRYLMDAVRGCAAIPLVVNRAGYDGAIELSLASGSIGTDAVENEFAGLSILNPTIPAGAKEARVFVSVSEGWDSSRLSSLRLFGRAKDQPSLVSATTNLDVQRLQRPYVPYPQSWSDGRIVLSGKVSTESLFGLENQSPLRLARYVPEQSTTFTLKRLHADFKAAATLLTDRLPTGWQANVKVDKDNFATTLIRSKEAVRAAAPTIDEIDLLFYAEHAGLGLLQPVKVPVQWYDPIRVSFQTPPRAVAGSKIPVLVTIERSIPAQPITLVWQNVPTGIQLPEKLTIAPDQNSASFDLSIAPEFIGTAPNAKLTLSALVASKFADKDFDFSTQTSEIFVVAAPKSIEVYPATIVLDSAKAKRQMVITGLDANGAATDWTSLTQLNSASPQTVEVKGSIVYPKSDGETVIQVRVGSIEQSVPVKVAGAANNRRTEFENEVLVALSKQGCNSGACHGSPSGKGMFRLSLRAFDKQLDELTLIREDFSRRINTVEPEQSLLLLKPLMKVAHGGGKQLRKEDAAYQVVANWIREGSKVDPVNTARCVRLEVFPNQRRTLAASGGSQQLSVTAHFADGSSRDVTELVAYESSNQQAATVDAGGKVGAKGRGETVILVRFLEHIESIQLLCIDANPAFKWQSPTPNNYVDELVYEKLRNMQYVPADVCNDAEYLRRVYLDLIGVLPTVDETRSFLGDSSPSKRAAVVDALLARPEYAKFWSLKWGDLLKLTNKLVGNDAVFKYHRWIENAITEDMPYDQFARQLITASGSTLSNPPANFYRTATDMNECVETISQVFIGARLQCAKCHNHPFERWTQDNYYGLAAFFNRVGRRETLRPGEMFIYANDTGEVTQPRTGQQMKPWLPSQGSIEAAGEQDRRELFAAWLTQQGNPYFAKIGANRIWSHLFARGIIDPVDDFRDSNPPVNAPLLDALASDFQQHNYSTKHLLKTILGSKTYQATYQATAENREDTLYFSHQQPRLLKAEQLLDAVNHVTGISQVFGSLPANVRATQLPAPDLVKVDFLKVFGQPERSTVCACERSSESNLAMAIELFNGPLVHERLRDPNNRFRKALASGANSDTVLDELYLAALCRLPNEIERSAALTHLKKREDAAAGFEDICWAIINTDEFLFQH